MPELRKDPVSGRWVIISIERGKRPSDFPVRAPARKGGFCAFCEGNEHTTPPEIIAVRRDGSKPDTPGWTLRVVPNKFPALRIEGEENRVGEGLFDKMNGIGAHEVIIETPDHSLTLATMLLKSVEEVLVTFQKRISDLKNDRRFRYVLVFKNDGETAGATLEHSHSQLIALPIVPRVLEEEIEHSKRYFGYKERCLFCDIIRQEEKSGVRIISENERFVAFAPFAPRSPFETLIMPKMHMSSFMLDRNTGALAGILQRTIRQMNKVLANPPYNLIIHSSPFRDEVNDYYHWHIEIKPNLTNVAGFEWGTGFYINPTPPEDAAKFMREAEV
jgi:UDPglucose--hexose-1-phosphate uridylyltransferase